MNRIQKVTHGTCRLHFDETIGLAACLDLGAAILALRPENMAWADYWAGWKKDEKGRLVSIRLEKYTSSGEDAVPVYEIDCTFGPLPAHWFCQCPADQYRKPGAPCCKHIRGIAAALSRHGLLPATEPRKPVATVELETL